MSSFLREFEYCIRLNFFLAYPLIFLTYPLGINWAKFASLFMTASGKIHHPYPPCVLIFYTCFSFFFHSFQELVCHLHSLSFYLSSCCHLVVFQSYCFLFVFILILSVNFQCSSSFFSSLHY